MSRFRLSGMLTRTTLVIGLATGVAAGLQGCVLALAGAAGGTALVATDRRTVGAQTEDREIQVKALSDLSKNLPDAAHVNVTVFNQRVLLTGEVPDPASKQKAETIVRGITNVNAIVNELAVQPASSFSSRTNDTYLEGRVKTELIAYKDISANNFKVVSERGTVYLMGLVTVDEGNIATDATSRVSGVEQVVKVFEYIKPEQAAAATAAAQATSAPAAANAAEEPTVGAVPDSSVSSRPIDQQPPAPVINSSPVHPGSSGKAM
ncbi:BON domain-containing protein [Paraburkholderia caballeronis]|uniref:BON domain-containing protein n=1 Tax=Paraburkholderia caballeronis TaxID=416943 RepID=UPI001065F282|nr:BON domain-containing protein [Paraburkholderia caballeronis]TDV18581.1 osmotically-inducible protein OsmY [Paraburkholderia caballeronis]TDV19881.1 osmotically-inducible protein OsmY [Paraburkholderia caballeronis]TDV28098.1 osmotically-inducible protein OsmY [Paraburkholderia caballeronis]